MTLRLFDFKAILSASSITLPSYRPTALKHVRGRIMWLNSSVKSWVLFGYYFGYYATEKVEHDAKKHKRKPLLYKRLRR